MNNIDEIKLEKADNDNNIVPFSQEPDAFFFESDHLALRGNKDYQNLLRAFVLLNAQKDELLKNYDTLNAALTLSEDKPLDFVNLLKTGELKLPERIKLVDVPKLDLQQYENNIPEHLLSKAKSIYNEDNKRDEKIDPYRFEHKRSKKADKMWTVEEQRRLEELLVEYPPEEIEMRRFAKIAKALGNRTTKQVASRIQKYFIKLHKAGLPVPGRLPKIRPGKRSLKNPVFHNAYSIIKPSTFFPTLTIPSGVQNLHIQDSKNVKIGTASDNLQQEQYTDDEVTESESDSDDSSTVDKCALRIIKRVLKDKQKDNARPYSIHVRHTCSVCKECPIVGTRWHCTTCTHQSIDFCSDCLVSQTEDLDNCTHPLSHNLIPFRSKSEYKPKDIKQEDDAIIFSTNDESNFMQYIINKLKYKEMSSEDFIKELLSLNFAKCNLIMQDNSAVNAEVFLKNKTVLNVYQNYNVYNNMFADCNDDVNVKLLRTTDKHILSPDTINLQPLVELLDHDYSFNADDCLNYPIVNEEVFAIGREEFV